MKKLETARADVLDLYIIRDVREKLTLKRADISVGHEERDIFLIPRVLYGLIAKRLKGKRVDWNPCVIDKLRSTTYYISKGE